MGFELEMVENTDLARLAWLARIDRRAKHVTVTHGRDVERGDTWLVEGVWPGPFSDLGFAEAEHFFGSGLKLTNEGVRLVPSCASVDRLLLAELDEIVYASNSLPLLLAATGARLDPEVNYGPSSYSITKGIDSYDERIPVAHERLTHVSQRFHDALDVTVDGIAVERLSTVREFSDFDEYVGELARVLEAIAANMRDPSRRKPMDAFGTLSRGYDSPAIAVLTRPLGVVSHFTVTNARHIMPRWVNREAVDDDGEMIGMILGLRVGRFPGLDRALVDTTELHFLSVSTIEPETVFYPLTSDLSSRSSPSVLFTGYQGDRVWDRIPSRESLTDELVGGGSSGLNLGEIRLKAGFINVAVPFVHARSISSINRISNSAVMESWVVGSDYDRPIPRRLIEEAGVPRGTFGVRKRAVIDWYREPHNSELRRDFLRWVEARYGIWGWRFVLSNRLSSAATIPMAVKDRVLRFFGRPESRTLPRILGRDLRPEQWLFIWAANRLAEMNEAAMVDAS